MMEFNQQVIKEGLNQALMIARERAFILENLKQALIEDDTEKIKLHARQLCGLSDESCRISESLNTGTE